MPYEVYKIIHIFGVILLFASLGGLAVHAINGGDKASNSARKLVMISHGLASLLVLVAGFGLLARLGGMSWPFPLWVWLKLGIWLLMGALLALPYKMPHLARPIFLALPVIGAVAAAIALYKPA